jgi:hypothetical protein
MIRTTLIIITLALALSACFNYQNPIVDDVDLSASKNTGVPGDEITFSATHDRGDAHITILETELEFDPPQTVRDLPVLQGASVSVEENQATLSVTLEEGLNRALGRDLYRFDDATRAILAWSGERAQVTTSGSLRLRSDSAQMVVDGIESATFSITMVGSDDEPMIETIALGEEKTVSLDGQSATLEITDVVMTDGKLEELTLLARYKVLIVDQSTELVFSMGSGKRIDTGTKRFDVYLTDVTYSYSSVGGGELYLVSGSEEVPFVLERPVMLGGVVMIPLSLSGSSATVLIDPEVVLIGSDVVRYPDETLMIDHSFDRTSGSFTFTETDSDSLFATYRLEEGMIIDTYSAQLVSSQDSSATYRFLVSGEYTAQVTVTDAGELVGDARSSVRIS